MMLTQSEADRFKRMQLFVETVGNCVLNDLLEHHLSTNNNQQSITNFIDNNSHEILHLSDMSGQCCKSNCRLGKNKQITKLMMTHLFDPTLKSWKHDRSKRKSYDLFCCNVAKSNLQVKNFDTSLTYCLLRHFCTELFWQRWLGNETLQDALLTNKHYLSHMRKQRSAKCCVTNCSLPKPGTNNTIPNKMRLNCSQWNILFTKVPTPTCPNDDSCCYKPQDSLKTDDLDKNLENILLMQFSELRNAVENLKNMRNRLSHKSNGTARLHENEFNSLWSDTEKNVMIIADSIGSSPKYRADIKYAKIRPLDEITAYTLYNLQLRNEEHIKKLQRITKKQEKGLKKLEAAIVIEQVKNKDHKSLEDSTNFIEDKELQLDSNESGLDSVGTKTIANANGASKNCPLKRTYSNKLSKVKINEVPSCKERQRTPGSANHIHDSHNEQKGAAVLENKTFKHIYYETDSKRVCVSDITKFNSSDIISETNTPSIEGQQTVVKSIYSNSTVNYDRYTTSEKDVQLSCGEDSTLFQQQENLERKTEDEKIYQKLECHEQELETVKKLVDGIQMELRLRDNEIIRTTEIKKGQENQEITESHYLSDLQINLSVFHLEMTTTKRTIIYLMTSLLVQLVKKKYTAVMRNLKLTNGLASKEKDINNKKQAKMKMLY